MNVERELRDALRRPEPPAGFAERVMARVAAGEPEAPSAAVASRPMLRAAAAAFVVLLVGWGGYRVDQQRRAEQAAEDVIAALRITSEKLNLAKDNIESRSAE